MPHDLLVRASRAVVDGREQSLAVAVTDGRITALLPLDTDEPAHHVHVLAEDEVLLPGLVDTHVHVNEPGRTEWEGFASATRAAAAGGVTTLVDMPLNSLPPTVDVPALETKRAAAEGQCAVDVAFWGGAVPASLGSLAALHEAGVLGFKCFLVASGVEEFPPLDEVGLDAAAAELATFGGRLVVHAEDAGIIAAATPPDGPGYRGFLASRPHEAEDAAVRAVLEVSRRHGTAVHVLHLSSAHAVPAIAAARADGVPVTAETCPHYLVLRAEEVPDGATAFKCCPPIRDEGNRDRLWAALDAGTIDVVVSDHSPCTTDLKALETGDFAAAWGGVASLQLGLRLVWTEASRRGHDLADVVAWMATGPADLVGLGRKGRIAVGADADLVVFAPDEVSRVDPATLLHRNPVTPYAGRLLRGAVRTTLLAGRAVEGPPRGRLLRRGD